MILFTAKSFCMILFMTVSVNEKYFVQRSHLQPMSFILRIMAALPKDTVKGLCRIP